MTISKFSQAVAMLALADGTVFYGKPFGATRLGIPLITTLTAAQAAVNGIRVLAGQSLQVQSLQLLHSEAEEKRSKMDEELKFDRVTPSLQQTALPI